MLLYGDSKSNGLESLCSSMGVKNETQLLTNVINSDFNEEQLKEIIDHVLGDFEYSKDELEKIVIYLFDKVFHE